MGERRKQRATMWLGRWGFAGLVALATLGSIFVAVTVATPAEVPGFALQAAPIYRMETGAATFLGLYLLAMALVLSLHNRGFTEIGMRGIKAQGLGGDADNRILAEQEGVIDKMKKAIEEMETGKAD
jgi:hypothetical protein